MDSLPTLLRGRLSWIQNFLYQRMSNYSLRQMPASELSQASMMDIHEYRF